MRLTTACSRRAQLRQLGVIFNHCQLVRWHAADAGVVGPPSSALRVCNQNKMRHYLALCVLLLASILSAVACSPSVPIIATPTVGATGTADVAPSLASPLTRLQVTWSHAKLPLNCSFHSLSPDLQWVLLFNCRTYPWDHDDVIAHIDNNGELKEFRSLKGKFTLMGDYDNVLGFTPDSSHIIVKRNDSYWLFSLPDLNQQPYLPDTRGVSGVTDAGTEDWSPDGLSYLGLGPRWAGDIMVIYPQARITDTIFADPWRTGTQFTWCAKGKKIAYTTYTSSQDVMVAQDFDLQSRQAHTWAEVQFPQTLTGASCSPSGKWIAIRQQDYATDAAATILWLVNTPTNEVTKLNYELHGGPEIFDGWRDMVWARDESILALNKGVGFAATEIPTGTIIFQGDGSPLAWNAESNSILTLSFHSWDNSPDDYYTLQWLQVR